MDPLIEKYRHSKGNLIPLLQGVQQLYGYLPAPAFQKLAEKTGLKISEMYGVATFYAQFRLKPVGKFVVKVCQGTACHVQNAGAITDALSEKLEIREGETTADRIFTLETVACLGCCSLAPVMMIGENSYGKLTGKNATRVIDDIRKADNFKSSQES
jgi:NADH-quinone oxidoreductase subunit E